MSYRTYIITIIGNFGMVMEVALDSPLRI